MESTSGKSNLQSRTPPQNPKLNPSPPIVELPPKLIKSIKKSMTLIWKTPTQNLKFPKTTTIKWVFWRLFTQIHKKSRKDNIFSRGHLQNKDHPLRITLPTWVQELCLEREGQVRNWFRFYKIHTCLSKLWVKNNPKLYRLSQNQ